jgi:endonuclease III
MGTARTAKEEVKPMTTPENTLPATIQAIHQKLRARYGDPTQHGDNEPLATLVNTILSQNTNDRNRDLAFAALRAQFPTWEAVRDAPAGAVIDAIRPAGLAPTKGPNIQAALRQISVERGELSLEFLKTWPLEEARRWLTHLNGVGPKTAAIVLLFALERPAFPVDTHVHRVTKRLGLIPPGTSREKAHILLENLIPEALYYPVHLNLIEHGRQTCHARRPACEVCPLQNRCVYYQTRPEGGLSS